MTFPRIARIALLLSLAFLLLTFILADRWGISHARVANARPTAVDAESEGCRLTSLSGTYGFAFSGYVNTGSSASPAYTPVAAAGTFMFHPDGTITRSFNISFGGTIVPVNDHGTYSLDSTDCNFTANLPDVGETWNLIPVEGGLQIDFFVNPGPRIGAGTMTHR